MSLKVSYLISEHRGAFYAQCSEKVIHFNNLELFCHGNSLFYSDEVAFKYLFGLSRGILSF